MNCPSDRVESSGKSRIASYLTKRDDGVENVDHNVSDSDNSDEESDVKTCEVVLAPRTAKSQTVAVSTNVTLVDSVSSRAVVAEVWHVVRSILDPRSLVSSAVMSQLLVVES
ncbi:hypothetical protein PHYSODRAFT_256014 [Phytophthora sojae]|uniref:Uncharacterized protein n=1 Tax=Phytophthora sojae (strain P6497) TaxID=1094619 RepID=G5A862_PHYSP|nr:hypothetical protein PHYSODRAFT_256014 [Phytophthora sojae]EGZ08088.1 hypothetical protein PHYSODRAFT_256014 [Phytophthora sojae]|eukprot:XP_009536260.1 hypothetical protein PHYSODRAFT_256014 [Phytophthora sojae]